MGLYHSTYWAYGIAIDADKWFENWEENEYNIEQIEFVQWLTVQDERCNNIVFITTEQESMEDGEYKVVSPDYIKRNEALHSSWNDALLQAIETLGIEAQSDPGYIFVHEVS